MCGFVIAITRPGAFDREAVQRSLSQLAHRGPDASAISLERVEGWQVWLGHQRLAIQDLDARANQPMTIRDSSIVYNGEVYNTLDLRRKLERSNWFSSSDTEVLLATLRERGPSSLANVNGMFAFAYLDREEKTVTLARDRLGQKPLYIYHTAERLIAASELKSIYALLEHSGTTLTRDEQALAHYRWLGYLPFSYTPYREIKKFRAATWASYRLTQAGIEPDRKACFWDPFARIDAKVCRTLSEAREACGALLDDATLMRTVSDRPIGVFLSGGVDSNLVATSLAKAHKDALAISVRSPGFDESAEAEQNAKLLGLPFCRITLNQSSYRAQLERIEEIFDEPFADQSAIPLMALCEKAVSHVIVALTGDGGDEPFVGYPWHSFPDQVWGSLAARTVRNIPQPTAVRLGASRFVRSVAGERALRLLERAAGRNPETARAKTFLVEELLHATSPEQLYDVLHSAQPPSSLAQDDREMLERPLLQAAKSFYREYAWEALDDRPLCEQLAALDLVTYLRDGVLVKADRSSMAYSMELRSPFLDHRLVELGLSLPLEWKARGGAHKLVLRELLRTRLDPQIAARPKSGFGVELPDNLPEAPTERGRWVKHCEKLWEGRWGTDRFS
jgi:asparagine synthase (glutamine-hydrolysing)